MSASEQTPPSAPAARLENITVGDVMHPAFVDCQPQSSMRTVARLMADSDVHSVIVDGIARRGGSSERLTWGLISDFDLAAALAAGRLDDAVVDFAAAEPVSVSPREGLREAARIMASHHCSHLIVTDEDTRRPVGVISAKDLARAIAWGARPTNRPASGCLPAPA